MATSTYLDLTEEMSSDPNGEVTIDVGEFIAGTVYVRTDGSVNFFCSNDGGEETNILGSALTAQNFSAFQMLDLAANKYGTGTGSNSIWKFEKPCKYLRLQGNATKLIVQLFKII